LIWLLLIWLLLIWLLLIWLLLISAGQDGPLLYPGPLCGG